MTRRDEFCVHPKFILLQNNISFKRLYFKFSLKFFANLIGKVKKCLFLLSFSLFNQTTYNKLMWKMSFHFTAPVFELTTFWLRVSSRESFVLLFEKTESESKKKIQCWIEKLWSAVSRSAFFKCAKPGLFYLLSFLFTIRRLI